MKKGNHNALSESDHSLINEITELYEQLIAFTGPEPAIYDVFGILPAPDEENSTANEEFKKAALTRKHHFLGATDKKITAKK
jgi:hypothetical protein